MQAETLFVLIFVVIIAIAIMTKNILLTALLISLLINAAQFGAESMAGKPNTEIPSGGSSGAARSGDPITYYDQETELYGPFWERYHEYNNGHNYEPNQLAVGRSFGERANSQDANNAILACARARDKRCSDGWASKNADFYKYHYANEFREAEEKRWWGNSDW